MSNQTTANEFVLLGFSDIRELQILHFMAFLFIYLVALMGNLLLIVTITKDHHLHSPMYFFLANLSFSDACYISATVPKSIVTSLTNNKRISYSGCVVQVFLVITCAGTELSLLTFMAYDRYVAICHPLQYTLILNVNACLRMAAASWISSVFYGVMHTTSTFMLHFCRSNVIKQYFCDVPPLLMISCTDIVTNEWLILVSAISLGSFCFIFILASYSYIFSTIFKMQSAQARYKAFSTCIPHLAVFSLFLITGIFSYLKPKSLSSPTVDLLAAVFYTALPPLMNPIIYSLRNKDMQVALWKLLNIWVISQGDLKNLFQKAPPKIAQCN